ncbi:MAG: TonB-dependent receptor [Hyphomonadaceae bacterium]
MLAAAPAAAQEMRLAANEVLVEGAQVDTGVARLDSPIEAPQAVHVVGPAEIKQQAITTLDQAVRMVPGITANTGEGGGAVAGDQFRIRGFDAAGDVSTDGLRDFGVYTRDSFNVESVQVYLGPSGQNFGRGSFGGAINTTSKVAKAGDFIAGDVSVGSAELARGTFDMNREIGEHTAVRFNLMGHSSGLADIDEVESQRWGAAASLALGLGTPLTATLSYFHQSDDRVPYYGVPVAIPTGETIARPLPVDRSNFYGTSLDRDNTDADVITARLAWDASDALKVYNDTRIGVFNREFMAVAPSCSNAAASGSALAQTCLTNFFDGDPVTVPLVNRGGQNGPYYLDQWGAQNITTLEVTHDLGGMKNQFTSGLDMAFEYAKRTNYNSRSPGTLRPAANAYDPDPAWTNPLFSRVTGRETDNSNVALFASDRLWFTEAFSVLAGVRWDRYQITGDSITYATITNVNTAGVLTSTYAALATPTVTTDKYKDDLFSPRISAIWEPAENTMLYASWARSAQPPTGSASAGTGTPVTANLTALDPTTAETFEIGGRMRILGGATGSISIFTTERDNAKETDSTGAVLASGDQQRVNGVELGISGSITDKWTVEASYTFLDTETLEASNLAAAAKGKEIPFAAPHSATLWTTYTPIRPLTLGFGARYTDKVWLNNTETAQAPEYVSIDAMVSYAFSPQLRVQLNATNLANRDENYDQVVGGRATHAPGRAFQLALGYAF